MAWQRSKVPSARWSIAGAGEHFRGVADPPYLRGDETIQFREDPLLAIRWWPDGLASARSLEVAAAHLAPGGALLVQVAGSAQAAEAFRAANGGPLSYD